MILIFWHNIISPHQAPFMRALGNAGHDVLVVSTEAMSEERRRMGWSIPELGSARIILNPEDDQVQKIIAGSAPDAIHFLAGARGTTLGAVAARACYSHNRRMGIITESPDPRGIAGWLRWIKYTHERITLGRRFDFVLAMGCKGIRWFNRCGYPEVCIFPFAYVTERSGDIPTPISGPGPMSCRTILFVGQLIPRKGVDLLLRAFALMRGPDTKLQLVGEGPAEAALRSLASTLGISGFVEWLGSRHGAEIPALMAHAHVMVLPSREDGWGAVVNESLMVGTPVICSDAGGAAELIRQKWLGGVFRSGSVEELAALMAEWNAREESGSSERERIRTWSRCIEGPSVAAYVEEILEHVYQSGPRPVAPWRKEMQ